MLVCGACREALGFAVDYCPFCGQPRPAVVVQDPPAAPAPGPQPPVPRAVASGAGPVPVPPVPPVAGNESRQAVQLTKGMTVSLSKLRPGLDRIRIRLGWSALAATGAGVELDGVLFMLGEDGRVRGDDDFIFYNQVSSPCGSVVLAVSEGTGAPAAPKSGEEFRVSLERVPEGVRQLVIGATLVDVKGHGHGFGVVRGGVLLIADRDTGTELVRFELPDACGSETAMIFGAVYRRNGEWKVKAVGQGFAGGLKALCGHFGVNVA